MYVCVCLRVGGCVPACLRSHPRLLSAASDQQFRGSQRSGPDQRKDASATRRRQQRGPVNEPHEHGRAQWDRQQQQYTVMDIHSHMPRHIPAVTTTLTWYRIYRYVYIGIYSHKNCTTHINTNTVLHSLNRLQTTSHTHTHTRLPTPFPLPSAVFKGMSVPGLYHQRLFTELIGPI